jgi:L-lactate dehydrogenase complex protein LldG
MSARDAIFERVRAALAGRERAALPEYDDAVAVAQGGSADLVALFRERLAEARGVAFDAPAALGDWLRARGAVRGYCDPGLAGVLGPALGEGLSLETELARDRIDDYKFGITRAAGAIAETGSLVLEDRGTSSRLGALAPWIHVAVVAANRIHAHLADAIAALGDDPYVLFATGPSKTADVEGILIEGVHGPGEQVALIVPQ